MSEFLPWSEIINLIDFIYSFFCTDSVCPVSSAIRNTHIVSVTSRQLHKKQCKNAADNPVRKTVTCFLLSVHIQNVIADNRIILRMKKKVANFFPGIQIPHKKTGNLGFITDCIIEDVHECTAADQNIQNDAVILHRQNSVSDIRSNQTQISGCQFLRGILKKIIAVSGPDLYTLFFLVPYLSFHFPRNTT